MSSEDVSAAVPEQTTATDAVQDVNFFKPGSEHAKANARLICLLVLVWVVAIFGFQFLQLFLLKPTPEAAHAQFSGVWQNISSGAAGVEEMRSYARACLSVLGKNTAVESDDKAVLSQAVAATVMSLLPAEKKNEFQSLLTAPAGAEKADPPAISADDLTKAVGMAAEAIQLEDQGLDKVMRSLLPSTFRMVSKAGIQDAAMAGETIPSIMDRYLIHNRSVLTDTTFMGFPFHYWYTAQFLLILFVGLCLAYAILIDKTNIKYGFKEE